MRVIVIGGGIGGLTAALSLHAAGIEAEVFEAVPDLKPLGVGINLLPHAVRELTELGLGDALAGISIATEKLMYAKRFGQEIWASPVAWRRAISSPSTPCTASGSVRTSPSRPQGRAVRPTRGRRDCQLRRRQRHGRCRGRGGRHPFSGPQTQLFPCEGPPKWNNRVLWRGVPDAAPYLDERTMVVAGHQDQKFVCYPIRRSHDAKLNGAPRRRGSCWPTVAMVQSR